ncbi:MAG: aminotransferase class V-fold PLP-dependent enzyme [Chloroflexota bacterium]
MTVSSDLIYLDNAATSWPKPPGVAAAMTAFLDQVGANPGRSGHRLSVEAARIVFRTRSLAAQLFNAPDPARVVFGHNVTAALNLALHGLLRPGDHVITSGMEHNSVMRPLRMLEGGGVEVTVVPCRPDGSLEPTDVESALRPATRLIALNHASNVCGTLLPAGRVGALAREHGVLLLVDAAQTAGAHPIDVQAEAIDLLAFAGHKSLYGPMGTGGLVLGGRVDLDGLPALEQGGTGSRSEREQQPDFPPDKYEPGTPNAVGLAGLGAALDWVLGRGVEPIRAHEASLCRQLIAGLRSVPGATVYGPLDPQLQTATVSFNLAGLQPSQVGQRLDEDYGVLCRVGLHCAPAAHRTLGTFPTGTVRFGLGAFNTSAQVEAALRAVRAIASSARSSP